MSELDPHIAKNIIKSSDQLPIKRSARSAEAYIRIFGEEFEHSEGLILDVGAGDSSFAEEIMSQGDDSPTVIRIDRDYSVAPPTNTEKAIAADARQLPIASNSIDHIISLWMMPYLTRDNGMDVLREMLRILKPGGQAALFPIRHLQKVNSKIAERKKNTPGLTQPSTLVITKPLDFETWDQEEIDEVTQELSNYLTHGRFAQKLIRAGMAKSINLIGTYRSVEVQEQGLLRTLKHSRH